MVRNIEKLMKIERPKEVSKLNPDTVEVVPKTLSLDLLDIDPHPEQRIAVHIDLKLDQIEDPEE